MKEGNSGVGKIERQKVHGWKTFEVGMHAEGGGGSGLLKYYSRGRGGSESK